MIRVRFASLAITVAALAFTGAVSAAPDIQSDYSQFVTHFPDLATPLDAGDFRHPAEIEMIDTLTTGNPGIRELIDQVKKDQIQQVKDRNLANRLSAVEVGPDQFPQVQKMAVEAAQALGLHTDFHVFITSNPEMEASIFGFPQHGHYGNAFSSYSILLTSGMVKALTADELKFVIGREMGHVKANHRFYSALMFAYQREKNVMPRLLPEDKNDPAPGLGGQLVLFFSKSQLPSRISEYTADRGGLVAVRDPKIGLAALAKIARGDLENTPGFDLAAYLQQVEQAAHDMTPADAAEMAGKDGYYPYVLKRVSESSRFGASEEYKALVDRATVNPFLMEAEALNSIGAALVSFTKRLADFKADPHTATLDPLQRDVIINDLTAKIDRRQKAVAELEALVLGHVNGVGLTAANPLFTDLVGTAKRRNDARGFKGVFGKLNEQIQFALSQPGLPAADHDALVSKKDAIDAVKDLAPKPHHHPHTAPPEWVESSDLPALVKTSVAELAEAASSDSLAFITHLDELKPKIRAACVKLVTEMPKDQRADLAELVSGSGGMVANLVAEVQAAGTDSTKLETLFDRHFEEARALLKVTPLFIIRRALSKYAGLDV